MSSDKTKASSQFQGQAKVVPNKIRPNLVSGQTQILKDSIKENPQKPNRQHTMAPPKDSLQTKVVPGGVMVTKQNTDVNKQTCNLTQGEVLNLMISTGANTQQVKQNIGHQGNEEQSGLTTDPSNASPAKRSPLETINETDPNANDLKDKIEEIKRMPVGNAITGKK